jgi:hypothetical protein
VERLLGAPPEQLATPPLAVLASVASPTPGEWRVKLVITREGTSRTRELRGHSCPELADAVALILALAIDPEVFSRSGGDAPHAPLADAGKDAVSPLPPQEEHVAKSTVRAASAPLGEPRLARSPPKPASAPSPGEHRFLGFLALGSSTALGVIPTPAFGVSLTGGLSSSALRLSVTASYFPQRRATSAEQPGLSAVMDLRTLSLSGCWMHGLARRLRAGACGIGEWGAVRARGEGATRVYSETQPWAATGLGGVALLGLSPDFELGLDAGLLVPWGRPKFLVANAQVYQAWPAVGSVRALLEVRFR